MILYHGSNVGIDAIDFTKSKPGKDFGIGFYLSADLNQAKDMAEKKALIFGGNPVVSQFEFDEDAASAELGNGYKRFLRYCLEWGEFVRMNRENKSRKNCHTYDIVYGPIANDTVGYQLRRLNAKIIDIHLFIKEIERMGGETFQYFFGTQRSLNYLRKL